LITRHYLKPGSVPNAARPPNPGFGGQEFIREGLTKIQQAATWRRDKALSYRISVDGGINDETGSDCARVGADTFVAGTSLFGANDMKSAVAKLCHGVSEAASHSRNQIV